MNYFPIRIEVTEGVEKGQVKICNNPDETPIGISFKVVETNVKPEPLTKLALYMKSYSYQDLIKRHSLNEQGMWKIKGEDPNCDWGGHHHQPELEIVEGRLEDVIKYGVELPRFWTWGGGGDFVKLEVVKKV